MTKDMRSYRDDREPMRASTRNDTTTSAPRRKPKIHGIVKSLGLGSTSWLIFTSVVMALGKEANIRIESELLTGIWIASIGAAGLFAVLSWLLADSTIQQDG